MKKVILLLLLLVFDQQRMYAQLSHDDDEIVAVTDKEIEQLPTLIELTETNQLRPPGQNGALFIEAELTTKINLSSSSRFAILAESYVWHANKPFMTEQEEDCKCTRNEPASQHQQSIGIAYNLGKHAYIGALYGYHSVTHSLHNIVAVFNHESSKMDIFARFQSVANHHYRELSLFEARFVSHHLSHLVGIGFTVDMHSGLGPRLQLHQGGFKLFAGYNYGLWHPESHHTILAGMSLIFGIKHKHLVITPFVPEKHHM